MTASVIAQEYLVSELVLRCLSATLYYGHASSAGDGIVRSWWMTVFFRVKEQQIAVDTRPGDNQRVQLDASSFEPPSIPFESMLGQAPRKLSP